MRLLLAFVATLVIACVPPDNTVEEGTPDAGGGRDGTVGPDDEFATCTKMDVIFAIDNSSSMDEEKLALTSTVFPALADSLLTVGNGLEDFRIALLDACPMPANYHRAGLGGDCAMGPNPWIQSTDPDVVGKFTCLGQVDSTDALCDDALDEDEQPIGSAIASLQEPWRSGANSGFSRDDALLLVIALTDEDEAPSPLQSADQIFDRLVAAKGDVQKMVFLGVAGASDCLGAYGEAEVSPIIRGVTERFVAEGRGVFWDLCAGRLEDGLAQAIAIVDSACEQFPGDD
jgi:hypothetical protein